VTSVFGQAASNFAIHISWASDAEGLNGRGPVSRRFPEKKRAVAQAQRRLDRFIAIPASRMARQGKTGGI